MSGSTRMKRLLLVATVVFLLPVHLFAGNTGKVTGVVKDKETGDALPGVNIVIDGTSMGATTNAKGEFTILGVPAGVYSVGTNMIGYAKLTKSNVRVIPDFTTRLDFDLVSADVQGTEIVTVAERPLIQKDQTMTMSVTTAEEIKNLPVRGFQAAANLGVGIIVSNTRNVEGGTGNVAIRGGRPNETGVYVDGFQQNNLLMGVSTMQISNSSVEEVQVITGGFDAEYGRSQSGILQVTTKSGSQKYSGNVEAIGDPGGLGIAESYGYKVLSAGIGGPVMPGNNKIRFYVSGEAREIDDAEPSVWGNPQFTLVDTGSVITYDHDSKPYTPSVKKDTVLWGSGPVKYNKGARPDASSGAGSNSDKGYNFQTKLTFDVIDNKLRVDLTGNYGQTIRRVQAANGSVLAPDWNQRREISNLNVGTIATYTVNPTSILDIGLNFYQNTIKTFNDHMGFSNVGSYIVHQSGGTGAGSYFSDGVIGDTKVGSLTYRQDFDQYVSLKSNYTNQIDKFNQVKAGFDFFRHSIRFLNIRDTDNPDGGANDNIGYGITASDPFITSIAYNWIDKVNDTTFTRTYSLHKVNSDNLDGRVLGPAHPISFSMYLQDKLEYEGLVLRAGVRYDLFNPGVKRLKNPADPTGQNDESQTGNNPVTGKSRAGSLGTEDYTASRNDNKISPRFSISFPVSEKTQFRMSYGKFFQQPNLSDLYVSPDFLSRQSLQPPFAASIGNPNLEAEESTQYEVGIRRAVSDKIALDVNAYYKDIQGLINSRAVRSSPNGLIMQDNADQGIIQGISMSLEVRRISKFSGRINYTLQSATGSGSGENSGFRSAWLGFSDTKFNAPLTSDQRHNINASLDVRNTKGEGPVLGGVHALENAGMNFLVQAGSGFPYTPSTITPIQTGGVPAGRPIARRNSQNGPWTFRIDMKADKTFNITDAMSMNVYVQVVNLLDRKNVQNVFAATGRADDNGFLQSDEFLSYTDARQSRGYPTYDVRFHNGLNWDTPRQARLGVILNF